jgi:hypothetical protein
MREEQSFNNTMRFIIRIESEKQQQLLAKELIDCNGLNGIGNKEPSIKGNRKYRNINVH